MTMRFGTPFDRLLALQRELDRAFENPLGFEMSASGRGVFPPVNVFREADGFLVRVEVPGVPPDKMSIELHGRTLTISGERDAKPVEGASYHRRERETGKFSRSFTLPANLDVEKASATHKHGILTIRVPLRAEAKPRTIAVQAA